MNSESLLPDLPMVARLERGELGQMVSGVPCDLPDADWDFLRQQESTPNSFSDITYDCTQERLQYHKARGDDEARLLALLNHFSVCATRWLRDTYPSYAEELVPDRLVLRTEEEATRRGPMGARSDYLHIDRVADRPTLGRRVLRLCMNINPDEPRVWATAGHFAELLGRFAVKHKIPARSRDEWISPPQSFVRLFTGEWSGRVSYDAFLLRLHHFLKEDDEYQRRAARKLWHFAPHTAWLMFTDGTAYAQLRGRYALEQTFFVPQECLALPDESPLGLLERFGIESRLRRAG